MKLYYFETPNGRKPCALAKHLNVAVDYVRVDLSKGEQARPNYVATNPNAKIPALEDGDVKLWESDAIMCYLAHKAGSAMWPKSEVEKIDVVRWLTWNAAHFSRHGGRLFFERVVKPTFGIGPPNEAEVQDATRYFKQFAAVLNGHLKGREYLVGDKLTVADFAVAALLPETEAAQLPLDGCGEIERWHATLQKLPAWQQPFPS